MPPIVTLTMNPALDVTADTAKVEPEHKLRCSHATVDAGGGGVNVARVITRLGGDVIAVYAVGGATGEAYRRRLGEEGVRTQPVEIAGATRQNVTIDETETGAQFRFVMEGPSLSEAEWRRCLDAADAALERDAWLVASGSLPPGAPEDFYARCVRLARDRGARIAVDCSGPALAAALEEGPDLVKPNKRELSLLVGRSLDDPQEQERAASDLAESGASRMVALTLGPEGALLATRDDLVRSRAPHVSLSSAVGAGDSFTAALVMALAEGRPAAKALRRGVAAGAAALLTPATELCQPGDVDRLDRELAAMER